MVEGIPDNKFIEFKPLYSQRKEKEREKEKKWHILAHDSQSHNLTERSCHFRPVWKWKEKFISTRKNALPGFTGQRNTPQMESCGLLPSPWLGLIAAICLHLSVQKAESLLSHPPSSTSTTTPALSKSILLHRLTIYWRQTSKLFFPQKATHFLLYGYLLFCLEQVLLFKNMKQNSFSYYKKAYI